MKKIMRMLLVEDNPADVELIREVLRECGLKTSLEVAENGREALDIVLSSNPPEIILLDLNLGVISGLEVLQKVKEERPDLILKVPVIVLTSSTLTQDLDESLRYGAKAYHIKPMELVDYISLLEMIYKYWTEYARLPGYFPPESKNVWTI